MLKNVQKKIIFYLKSPLNQWFIVVHGHLWDLDTHAEGPRHFQYYNILCKKKVIRKSIDKVVRGSVISKLSSGVGVPQKLKNCCPK